MLLTSTVSYYESNLYSNDDVLRFLQYPLYTVMVFDDWRHGIPVAFFVISRSREQDLSHVLQV
jgi:hypothetical protein